VQERDPPVPAGDRVRLERPLQLVGVDQAAQCRDPVAPERVRKAPIRSPTFQVKPHAPPFDAPRIATSPPRSALKSRSTRTTYS
jgi:hypothetical protein